MSDDSELKCEECGYKNPPGESICQACNATLSSTPTEGTTTTGRYRQIRAKVDEVKCGNITPEQFRTWLEHLSNLLAEKAKAIVQNIEATKYYGENADECNIGMGGVRTFESGMEELWQYSQDNEPAHLEHGLALIWDGNQQILEAMRINRQNRDALTRLWDDLQFE